MAHLLLCQCSFPSFCGSAAESCVHTGERIAMVSILFLHSDGGRQWIFKNTPLVNPWICGINGNYYILIFLFIQNWTLISIRFGFIWQKVKFQTRVIQVVLNPIVESLVGFSIEISLPITHSTCTRVGKYGY